MPGKKGKQGKRAKKGKKGKRKGKKKSKDQHMSAAEALLAYQINVAEQKLEEILYETHGWREKIHRNRLRNEKLRQEQDSLLKNLLKANREATKCPAREEITTRDDVIDFMKATWNLRTEKEMELEELKKQIFKIESEIEQVGQEVSEWRSFQESGQHKQQLQIRLLEHELTDMETSFQDMAARLNHDQDQALRAIEMMKENALSQQKDKASEKALAQLNKNDRQEMLDNTWLKQEVRLHAAETDKLSRLVETLEQENLELMSQLFECSVDDLKVSRSCFLTQCEDSNLDHSSLLEIDLATISFPTEHEFEQKLKMPVSSRPKSAILRAVEEKVLSLTSHRAPGDETQTTRDTDQHDQIQTTRDTDQHYQTQTTRDTDQHNQTQTTRDTDQHNQIQTTEDTNQEAEEAADELDEGCYENFYFEEENFEDYLKLGPLELKLLSLRGHQVHIHQQPPLTQAEAESKQWNPDQWPVTAAMLKGPLLPQLINDCHHVDGTAAITNDL